LRLLRSDAWEFAERSGIVGIEAWPGEQAPLGKAIDIKVYAGLYAARTLS
jgi:hypothetical protein